jgi:hypothetical protein
MFLYKGGQDVGKGTYWEPDKGIKIVLKDDGLLPGNRKETYFKLPESYLLIPAILLGLGLSMAFPYGLGLAVFFGLIVMTGALYTAGSACFKLLKEMLGRNAAFGYAPTTSYMAGKKVKKIRKEESTDEGKNDSH